MGIRHAILLYFRRISLLTVAYRLADKGGPLCPPVVGTRWRCWDPSWDRGCVLMIWEYGIVLVRPCILPLVL